MTTTIVPGVPDVPPEVTDECVSEAPSCALCASGCDCNGPIGKTVGCTCYAP